MLDESIRDAQLQQGHLQPFGGQQFGHTRPGAAGDCVLFHGDQCAVTVSDRDDEIVVERFDKAHVDQRRIQSIRDRLGGIDHRSERQNRQSATALAPHLCASQRQRGHLGGDRHARAGAARISNRGRSIQRAGRI